MHWILQENIYKEEKYDDLVQILKRTNTPHTFVKVVPFVGEVQPDIEIEGSVVCFGQYSMRHAAKKKGWNPGVWDLEKKHYGMCLEHWGEHMLNADAQIIPLKHIDHFENRGPLFYRPADDSKNFVGGVYEYEYMKGLRETAMSLMEDEVYYGLQPDTMVIGATPQEIFSEYRTWIIDGKLITASQYKQGDRVLYSSVVDVDILEFAQQMIDIWQPDVAFCLDICRTERGLRIVEINTMNAAGFYAADVFKIFEAVESF